MRLVVHHELNIHHIRDQRLTGRCTATSNPYTPSAHANTPTSADRLTRKLSGCRVLARILTAVEIARAPVASGTTKFRTNTITSISSTKSMRCSPFGSGVPSACSSAAVFQPTKTRAKPMQYHSRLPVFAMAQSGSCTTMMVSGAGRLTPELETAARIPHPLHQRVGQA